MTRTAIRIAATLAASAALCACQAQGPKQQANAGAGAPAAPQNACMQLTSVPGAQPQALRPVAYDTPNLETCATYLEGVRLEQNHDVVGVWNGVWIFADAKEITSAADLTASRYAVFAPDQRAQIDQSLKEQLAAQKQGSSKPHAPTP